MRAPGHIGVAALGTLWGLLGAACAGPGDGRLVTDGWRARVAAGSTLEELRLDAPALEARGAPPMVVGTTGRLAVEAGYEALAQGGSAMDAALTTALTQVALSAGAWVSYAGLMTLVVYDAETGEVHSLNAGFAIPQGERDALSIPETTPSGRTALVPGFLRGVEAAHDRFGRLPFAALFGPAIHVAEAGFPLPAYLEAMIAERWEVLSRRPATRSIFLGPGGAPLAAGERFRQPALARTLRRVAREGADVLYRGPWAEALVQAVREEGGTLSLEDLARYRAPWDEPYRGSYRGFDILTVGEPGLGGVHVIEALNLLEAGGVGSDLYDPTTLFWWLQATNVFGLSLLAPGIRNAVVPDADSRPKARLGHAWARYLWRRMEAGELPLTRAPQAGSHSDAVLAVDAEGNAVALVHTINTTLWGGTGIFVDGVSITDAASYQQVQIAAAGAGGRLPDPTNPLIVLRDGKPVLVSAAIGTGLHHRTVPCLVAVLAAGKTPAEALNGPSLLLPAPGPMGSTRAQVPAGDFPGNVLEAVRDLGQPIDELDPQAQGAFAGLWIGVQMDPVRGELRAGWPPGLGGAAVGGMPRPDEDL